MLVVVTLKLTQSEIALADWLAKHRGKANRSAALRDALYAHALLHEAPEKLQRAAHAERSKIPEPLFAASVYAKAKKGRAKEEASGNTEAKEKDTRAARVRTKKKGE